MTILLFILGLLLFLLLVVLHEYGHFLVAKRNGVVVEEFGVGFPPKVFGKTFGKGIFRSYYTVNLLPLGGFVKLQGEHDNDKNKGDYGAASLWAKVKIMMAGVFVNFVTAIFLFTIVALIGMPQVIDNQFQVRSDSVITRDYTNVGHIMIGSVNAGGAADLAGIKEDDRIVSINGELVQSESDLLNLTSKYNGQNVTINIQRGNENLDKMAKLSDQKPYFGVSMYDGREGIQLKRSTWSAPIVALGTTVQFTQATLSGLGSIFSNLFRGDTAKATENVSGPIGIYVILKEGAKIGVGFVIFIIAILSLTLAIMNALPIPALDGGRLWVTLIYHGIKKPLKPKTEEWIHGTGFVLLLGLMLLISVIDVRRFF